MHTLEKTSEAVEHDNSGRADVQLFTKVRLKSYHRLFGSNTDSSVGQSRKSRSKNGSLKEIVH